MDVLGPDGRLDVDTWLWLPIGFGLAMLPLVAWVVWRDTRRDHEDATFLVQLPPSEVARGAVNHAAPNRHTRSRRG